MWPPQTVPDRNAPGPTIGMPSIIDKLHPLSRYIYRGKNDFQNAYKYRKDHAFPLAKWNRCDLSNYNVCMSVQ